MEMPRTKTGKQKRGGRGTGFNLAKCLRNFSLSILSSLPMGCSALSGSVNRTLSESRDARSAGIKNFSCHAPPSPQQKTKQPVNKNLHNSLSPKILLWSQLRITGKEKSLFCNILICQYFCYVPFYSLYFKNRCFNLSQIEQRHFEDAFSNYTYSHCEPELSLWTI